LGSSCDATMKREWEGYGEDHRAPKKGKGGGKGGKGHHAPPRTRCALKALCTENLSGSLLRNKGQVKDAIQEESGAKLIFSNKGDYFPSTAFRVLGLFADQPDSISRALQILVDKVIEVGEEERQSGAPECELLGKEYGEYVVRLALTWRMSGLIIGDAGANIQKLRQETGAKVFIDNDGVAGHRMVRVIGHREALAACVTTINDTIQSLSDPQDFQDYCSVINFSEVADYNDYGRNDYGGGSSHNGGGSSSQYSHKPSYQAPPPHHARGGPVGGGGPVGAGVSVKTDSEPPRSGSGRDRERIVPLSQKAEVTGKHEPVTASLDFMADTARSFPSGTLDAPYALFFYFKEVEHWSQQQMDDVRDAVGQIAEEMEIATVWQEDGSLQLNGPLLAVYATHLMIIRKVQEIEAFHQGMGQNGSDAAGGDVEALKQQVAALQQQLAEAQRSQG